MLLSCNLLANQEGKIISTEIWKQRESDLRAISESPEASLQYGSGLRHRPKSEKLISLNSPGDDEGRSKVKVMGVFLYRSLAHLYPRPSTSEVPCWMTHSWLHSCLKKYWVEIALALAPVPQWSHSGSWSIMMRFCLNYNLQQIFCYFF